MARGRGSLRPRLLVVVFLTSRWFLIRSARLCDLVDDVDCSRAETHPSPALNDQAKTAVGGHAVASRPAHGVSCAATVPGDLTRDHRRIAPEPQTDLGEFQGLGQAVGISSRRPTSTSLRTCILSHRLGKIKCYDRLSPRPPRSDQFRGMGPRSIELLVAKYLKEAGIRDASVRVLVLHTSLGSASFPDMPSAVPTSSQLAPLLGLPAMTDQCRPTSSSTNAEGSRRGLAGLSHRAAHRACVGRSADPARRRRA